MADNTEFSIPQVKRHGQMTAHEYAYARLHNGLMVGAIGPGTALKIRALAEYFGISPTPVREALRRLSSESALEVLGNRRIIVPRITPGRFEELVLLRIELECLAATRALPYVSDILIARMGEVDGRMDDAVRVQEFDTLTVLNHEFHELLYLANPHQGVMPLIKSVWLQLGPFQRQIMDRVIGYYLVDHHKEILGALGARNATALCRAIRADIEDGVGRAGDEVLNAAP